MCYHFYDQQSVFYLQNVGLYLLVTKHENIEFIFGIFHSVSVSVSVSVRVRNREFGIGTKKVQPVVPNTEIPKMHSVLTALESDMILHKWPVAELFASWGSAQSLLKIATGSQ